MLPQPENQSLCPAIKMDSYLDRKAERNTYAASLINLEQSQRRYALSEDNVILDVRQTYRNLEEAAAQYKIQQNSLELAKRRVDSAQLFIDAGMGVARDLLEAQDALLDAENALTDALIRHAIAKLNFYKDIGLLQVRPDGMWEI
jgi:outer membrane protein TolC